MKSKSVQKFSEGGLLDKPKKRQFSSSREATEYAKANYKKLGIKGKVMFGTLASHGITPEQAYERRKRIQEKNMAQIAFTPERKAEYFALREKNRANQAKKDAASNSSSSSNTSAPSKPSSSPYRGEVIPLGGIASFKKGGMVKKKKISSKSGSSCVGIAKRGFGKALK